MGKTVTERQVQTIREAVRAALEGIPKRVTGDADLDANLVRVAVLGYVHAFALRRDVILSDTDISSELEAIAAEIGDVLVSVKC
jgi:hypothetical protein